MECRVGIETAGLFNTARIPEKK